MRDRADRKTTTRAAHHDPLLTAFRSAWEAGENPRIEHFVSAAGLSGYELLPDLLQIELSQRCRRGEQPRETEYLDRFPAQRESLWHPSRTPNILDMRNDQVSDEDLMRLKPEWRLEILDLEGTKVTDVGLTSLSRLVTLRYVVLRRTAASTEGIRQLRDSLRKLRVVT
jgi:hypothetical protein